jgi:predicted translin family RNA/ssDNA-binding protein
MTDSEVYAKAWQELTDAQAQQEYAEAQAQKRALREEACKIMQYTMNDPKMQQKLRDDLTKVWIEMEKKFVGTAQDTKIEATAPTLQEAMGDIVDLKDMLDGNDV